MATSGKSQKTGKNSENTKSLEWFDITLDIRWQWYVIPSLCPQKAMLQWNADGYWKSQQSTGQSMSRRDNDLWESNKSSFTQKWERWEKAVKRIWNVLYRCLIDSALSLSRSSEKQTSPRLTIFSFSSCVLSSSDWSVFEEKKILRYNWLGNKFFKGQLRNEWCHLCT